MTPTPTLLHRTACGLISTIFYFFADDVEIKKLVQNFLLSTLYVIPLTSLPLTLYNQSIETVFTSPQSSHTLNAQALCVNRLQSDMSI